MEGSFRLFNLSVLQFTLGENPSNLCPMEKHLLLDHLLRHRPQTIIENNHYAAVSIILWLNQHDHELFLIKRTAHPNDPWSGQIGLPGGHQEEKDSNLIETAIRETQEETQIILKDNHFVAQIDDQQGYASGGKINLTVRPFVFFVEQKPAVKINYELESHYWLPLTHFQQDDNHIYFNPMSNYSDRPGVRLDESNILWGMTYRILTDFFNAIRVNSPFVGDYDRER